MTQPTGKRVTRASQHPRTPQNPALHSARPLQRLRGPQIPAHTRGEVTLLLREPPPCPAPHIANPGRTAPPWDPKTLPHRESSHLSLKHPQGSTHTRSHHRLTAPSGDRAPPIGLSDHPGSGAARSQRTTPAPSGEQKREGGSGGAGQDGKDRSPLPPHLPAPPSCRSHVPPRHRQGAVQHRRRRRGAGRAPE